MSVYIAWVIYITLYMGVAILCACILGWASPYSDEDERKIGGMVSIVWPFLLVVLIVYWMVRLMEYFSEKAVERRQRKIEILQREQDEVDDRKSPESIPYEE